MEKNKPIATQQTEENKRSAVQMLSEGLRMEKTTLVKTIGYFVVLVLFLIVYIANAHYNVKVLRKIKDTKEDLKEVQAEYVSLKAELARKTKASEISKSLKEKEVKELRQPPYVIEVAE